MLILFNKKLCYDYTYNVFKKQEVVLETLLMIIQFISSVGLIACILMQTSKSEGLSGTLGGHRESVFRGRKGAEDILDRVTTFFAVSFLAIAFFISILF